MSFQHLASSICLTIAHTEVEGEQDAQAKGDSIDSQSETDTRDVFWSLIGLKRCSTNDATNTTKGNNESTCVCTARLGSNTALRPSDDCYGVEQLDTCQLGAFNKSFYFRSNHSPRGTLALQPPAQRKIPAYRPATFPVGKKANKHRPKTALSAFIMIQTDRI